MNKRGIRFGIICDTLELEEWQYNCIKNLIESVNIELNFIMLNNERRSGFSLLSNLLKKKFGVNELLGDVKKIPYKTKTINRNVVNMDENATGLIKRYETDFILNISSNIVKGELLDIARYGVWSFKFSTYCKPFFWEIHNEDPITTVALCKIGPEDTYIPLMEGFFSTYQSSYTKNKKMITLSAADWPLRVCEKINAGIPLNYRATSTTDTLHKKSTYLEVISLMMKISRNKMKTLYSKLFCYEYWSIGIVNKPIQESLTDTEPSINWIISDTKKYLADPFAFKYQNEIHVLMEEVDHRVVKGFISEIIFSQDQPADDFRMNQAKLSLPSHMSYPYILEHEDNVYCIPETSEAREVTIYKLNKQTNEWGKVKTIIRDFPAVDSTIVRHGEYWWLFCTKASSSLQSQNNELHVFYSLDLLGNWEPHQSNPVKIDVRSSRSAGTPFYHNKELYRPAQDCSKTYGGKIVINRIKVLSLNKFEEETVSIIQPKSDSLYSDGLHTISTAGEWTILDGKRFEYHVLQLFRKLYRYKPMTLYEHVGRKTVKRTSVYEADLK